MKFSSEEVNRLQYSDLSSICEENQRGICSYVQAAVRKTGSSSKMSGGAAVVIAVAAIILYDLIGIYRDGRLAKGTRGVEHNTISSKFIFRICLRVVTTSCILGAVVGVCMGSLVLSVAFAASAIFVILLRNLIHCIQKKRQCIPEQQASLYLGSSSFKFFDSDD